MQIPQQSTFGPSGLRSLRHDQAADWTSRFVAMAILVAAFIAVIWIIAAN